MNRFNPDDYEDVQSRLNRWYAEHPNGRTTTRIEHMHTDDTGALTSVIVSAAVYRDQADEHPAGTGLAQEHRSDRGVNLAFALENCETSSLGRALVNAGQTPLDGKRPSRQEMQKAADVAAHKTTRGDVPSERSAGVPSAGGVGTPSQQGDDPVVPTPPADPDMARAVAEVARNIGGVEVPVKGAETARDPEVFARSENAKRIAVENGFNPTFAGGRKDPSEKQLKMLGARFKDLGVTDKAARLAYVRHALGRPEVNSPDDLLSGEMSVVIDLLGLDLDRQAEAGKEANREDPWNEEAML